MRAVLTFLAATLMASPSFAATKTVTLTDEEQKVLVQLLDLGVKSGGLSVAGNADYLMRKIQNAPDVMPAPAPTPPAPPPVAKPPEK